MHFLRKVLALYDIQFLPQALQSIADQKINKRKINARKDSIYIMYRLRLKVSFGDQREG